MSIPALIVQYWPRLIAGLGLTVEITIISLYFSRYFRDGFWAPVGIEEKV